jgi:hypothetical protein
MLHHSPIAMGRQDDVFSLPNVITSCLRGSGGGGGETDLYPDSLSSDLDPSIFLNLDLDPGFAKSGSRIQMQAKVFWGNFFIEYIDKKRHRYISS